MPRRADPSSPPWESEALIRPTWTRPTSAVVLRARTSPEAVAAARLREPCGRQSQAAGRIARRPAGCRPGALAQVRVARLAPEDERPICAWSIPLRGFEPRFPP